MPGEIIKSFSTPSTSPWGITFDGKYLWHSDDNTDKIYQLDLNGKEIKSFSTPGAGPRGLDFDGKNLLIGDTIDKKVYTIDRNGKEIKSFSTTNFYSGGVMLQGANLWTCLSFIGKQWDVRNRDGIKIKTYTFGWTPAGGVFDGKYLWVIDTSSDVIYQLDINFNTISQFSTPGANPKDITFDGQNLWVTDDTGSAEKIYQIRRQ